MNALLKNQVCTFLAKQRSVLFSWTKIIPEQSVKSVPLLLLVLRTIGQWLPLNIPSATGAQVSVGCRIPHVS